MRAVAYSIQPFEKEPLSRANKKKHDITLIANALNLETASYAAGKEAVIVFANDDLSSPVINRLADLGVKYITTRSGHTDHIDLVTAKSRGMKIANVPALDPQVVEQHKLTRRLLEDASLKTISNLDKWQDNKCVGNACACAGNCDTTAPHKH